MVTTEYTATVKNLLRMIYDHELNRVPDASEFSSQVRSWAEYLSAMLQIPENQLLTVYRMALDIRNDTKVSAKFRLQDMQAAWVQMQTSDNYKKQVPTTVCSLCNNTGYVFVYSPSLMAEVKEQCNH